MRSGTPAASTADTTDRLQLHQLLKIGKDCYFSQLSRENRTPSAVCWRTYKLHKEQGGSNLFVLIKSRLYGARRTPGSLPGGTTQIDLTPSPSSSSSSSTSSDKRQDAPFGHHGGRRWQERSPIHLGRGSLDPLDEIGPSSPGKISVRTRPPIRHSFFFWTVQGLHR